MEDSVTTTFTATRPNGEGCGPVGYSVRVMATNRGITALPVGATASPTS